MRRRTLLFSLLVVLLLGSYGTTQAQQPPPTREFYAEINGALIRYTITGQGVPLLLIHGYPLNGELFNQQRAALSRVFQVITPDLRGFGLSRAPNEGASIDIYTADMLALLDRLGIQRAVIGGHSMGGITTLNMYRYAPSRFRAMVLIDTTPMPAPIVEQFMWRGYAQQSRLLGAESLLPLLLPEFLTGATRQTRPDLVAEVSDLIRQASLNGLVGGANALAERPDLTSVPPAVSVPTLILYGEEDSLTPIEIAKMLNASIPPSELVIIPGASHGAIREAAEQANAAILRWAAQTLNIR